MRSYRMRVSPDLLSGVPYKRDIDAQSQREAAM